MPLLFLLVTLVGSVQMLVVVFCSLLMLFENLFFVFIDLFEGTLSFLVILMSGLYVLLFFFSVEFKLILRMLDGVIDVFFLIWLEEGVLDASWATTIDFEVAFGSSW